MTSKTDHTREASVPPGLRTDAEHQEFAEDNLQAKWRRVVERRSFLKADGLAGAAAGPRSGTFDRPDALRRRAGGGCSSCGDTGGRPRSARS